MLLVMEIKTEMALRTAKMRVRTLQVLKALMVVLMMTEMALKTVTTTAR